MKPKDQITFDIGTNFENGLVESIAAHNGDGVFASVFGKLKDDLIGGGRASMLIPEISREAMASHIALCHANGIEFNYLLNPICMGNREVAPETHKEILSFLGELDEMGVDAVTINSPYLCEVIKTQFPRLKITVGVFAEVGTSQRIRYWEELGADEITLVREATRNFKLLEACLRHTKQTGTGVRIFANSVCLTSCPFAVNHAVGMSHASRTEDGGPGMYIDYNILSCNYNRIGNPVKLMGSSWIRPEDIHYYEELCDRAGNHNLSLKLIDRTKTTAWLSRVVKAYAERRYDGNLLDILNYHTSKNSNHREAPPVSAMGDFNMEVLKKIGMFFDLPELYIDNTALDGFLTKFVKHYDCQERICDDLGMIGEAPPGDQGDDTRCSYCRRWAEKVISCDDAEVRRWLAEGEAILGSMRRSEIFYA
ncbi:U32 family peptidase [Desulfoluna butyratoxydans]|uniref:Peptidase u32 n=1 Tax=Desulfoluna butyratoxydans TaxID=231438 RepID=A0A4U8YQY5_9BACT|nr:U32 family peptidase [Desulfoluna butyratoxydans]VFQ46270.1 peptidase u32 [Desulfoluna butyratoxydans]